MIIPDGSGHADSPPLKTPNCIGTHQGIAVATLPRMVRAIKKGVSEQPTNSLERAARIRLLLMDCDGVLTDGTVFFLPSPDGAIAETKGFDCHDGIALRWARQADIETGIITGRGGLAVQQRAKSSDMRYLVEGRTDKLASFEEILTDSGLCSEQVAYVGDDITDLPLLKRVGLAVGPANSRPEVREVAHWITPSSGGRGAIRDVIELLLKAQGRWEEITARYDI